MSASSATTSTQSSCANSKHHPTTHVSTPVNYRKLQSHLNRIGYDKSKTEYLVHGFQHGFRLEHMSTVSSSSPKNDHSIADHKDEVQRKIDIELEAGRLRGPFNHPPFKDFHVSPLKIVPKSTRGKFRLIHNLSWPYDDSSINSQIPQESKSVQYSSVQKAIKLIMKFPKGSFTRKTDIKDAFKIIPIHPDDHHKLGFMFNNKFYYDVTLPMGAGSACQIFEAFSTALQAIYDFDVQHGGLSTHYLDDLFFVDSTYSTSIQNSRLFDDICRDIGVPQALQKKTLPSQQTEFLGIDLDSLHWIASLPSDKLETYVESIHTFSNRLWVTKTQLQSVIGQLSFAASVVPARAFLRRLIDKLCINKRLIMITPSMLRDLETWLKFFQSYNGVTYFRAISILPNSHYNMGADASRQGYGATFAKDWIQEEFPPTWQKIFDDDEIGSSVLELYPIVALIATFGYRLHNSSILFHSDNLGVVNIINKQTSSSKNPIMMVIVRSLVLLLMKLNIQLRSQHIPGVKNHLCDLISRFKVTPRILRDHGMHVQPTRIPLPFRSRNFKLS